MSVRSGRRISVRWMSVRWMAGTLASALAGVVAGCFSAQAPAPAPKAPAAQTQAAPAKNEQVVTLTLKKFEYMPEQITVHKGVPVVLELTALDRTHGFLLRAFGVDVDVKKAVVTRVRFVPNKAGTFEFHCDVYCGDNHEDMTGTLVVLE
jgi:cytochrome c oxidase subunit II